MIKVKILNEDYDVLNSSKNVFFLFSDKGLKWGK